MRRVIAIAALAPLLAVGCAGVRPSVGTVVRSANATPPTYRIGCPDVVAVQVAGHPQLDCVVAVDLDGRLPISDVIQPQVEGGTLDDARRAVAAAVGCPPSGVTVHLADPRTGRLYLFGPEQNRQRVVTWIGAERLVDFLDRTGGLGNGCSDLRDVFVLRPNVAAGTGPEVFRADLSAVQHGDHTTNVVLEPGDQVYVGETRRSQIARLLPDWLKPSYLRMSGLREPLAGQPGRMSGSPAAVQP